MDCVYFLLVRSSAKCSISHTNETLRSDYPLWSMAHAYRTIRAYEFWKISDFLRLHVLQ